MPHHFHFIKLVAIFLIFALASIAVSMCCHRSHSMYLCSSSVCIPRVLVKLAPALVNAGTFFCRIATEDTATMEVTRPYLPRLLRYLTYIQRAYTGGQALLAASGA